MKYTVYTLFPQLFAPWTQEALLGKAAQAGLINFDIRDLRSHANNKHNRVDDSPYGGGAGMVIRVDVAARAIEEVQQESPPPDEIILLSPAGDALTQSMAEQLARRQHICFVCGRYEGFDARVESYVSTELSIGDYVLMGGEIAALCVIEATARLIPGVLGDADSYRQDSFSTGLLDYPEYTRPPVFAEQSVPDILLSGHHAEIDIWRRQQALSRTLERRPDLLRQVNLSREDLAYLKNLGFIPEAN